MQSWLGLNFSRDSHTGTHSGFGYTKFHKHDVYCTPSTKKLSTALGTRKGETGKQMN